MFRLGECVYGSRFVDSLRILGKGAFERRTLKREQFGSFGCDVHVIFQSNTEFPTNVNAWLIAEHHVLCEFGLIPAD